MKNNRLEYSKLLTAATTIVYLTLNYIISDTHISSVINTVWAILGADIVILCLVTYFADAETYIHLLYELLKDRYYATVITDTDMHTLYINSTAETLFKNYYSPLQFIDKYAADDKSALLKIHAAYLGNFSTETSITCRDENNIVSHYRIKIKPLNKKIIAWIFEDISADIAILDTMDNDIKFLVTAANNIPSMQCICDIEGNIRYINSAFLKITGYIESEIKGKNIGEISDITANELTENTCRIAMFTLRNNTKSAFLTVKSMHTVKNENLVYLSAIETKKEEQDYDKEQTSSTFKKLFTESPIGIVFCTNWGDITDANQAMHNMLNLKSSIGSSIIEYIIPNDRSYFLSQLEKISLSNSRNCQSAQVEMIAENDGEAKQISVMVYISKRYSDNDKIEGLTLHFIDITKEKLAMTQLQAYHSEETIREITGGIAHDIKNRMMAIETAAESLMIGKNVEDEFYKEASIISDGVKRVKDTINSLLFRAKKQTLKKEYVEVGKIIDNYKPEAIRRLLNPEIKDKIKIITDYGNARVDNCVRVDLNPIYDSIDNLIINASDAMYPKGGDLYIKFSDETVTKKFQYQVYNTTETIYPGNYLRIEVTDTGCGIEEKYLGKIFDHYFTTKQGKGFKNSGSGIGLSIVYGTIRQSNGHILVDSKVGIGTSFIILLPKEIERKKIDSDALKNAETHPSGNQVITSRKPDNENEIQYSFVDILDNKSSTNKDKDNFKNSNLAIAEESGTKILLVEDDDDIRFLASKIISNLGYEVVACDCAENAHTVIQTDKNFKLMLSDVMMPGMSGIEFLKIIRKEIKNIKVILMSGYSEGLINEEVTESDTLKIISKPFSMADLSQTIKNLLSN